MPLVSVIVPTYNGAKRITKTLQSIIAQDYENLEIIVVDDVSTDNTVAVVQSVLEKSGRKFQIIRRTVNGRQSASRNTGIKAANGKYVIFFDHDDLAEKNFVSRLCEEAEAKEADLVLCRYQYYYEKENKIVPEIIFPKEPLPSQEDYLLAWAKEKIALYYIWNCIFNKNFLEKNNLKFCEKLPLYEDGEFILKAVACSSSMSSVYNVLYTHVDHSNNTGSIFQKNDLITHFIPAMWHAGRCILRHNKNRYVRNYVLSYLIAVGLLKQLTVFAENNDCENYNLKLKHLKHKKIREIFLGTIKFIFRKPELFLKSLMILYAPGLYFKLRK